MSTDSKSARIAAKWWLQARNRNNLAGEAIAIRIGHEIDPAAFIVGIEDGELQREVADTMRKIDERTAELASAPPSNTALLRQALGALERYSRWAADMDTELTAANVISDIKARLGID